MNLIDKLKDKWHEADYPFLIHSSEQLRFSDIESQTPIDLSAVNRGDVVALIGDFNPSSILTLLRLIDLGTIIVPLTKETKIQHPYFFESALVNKVIEDGNVVSYSHDKRHDLIDTLREKKHAGLVLFSTGTTGQPKAILHDLTRFLKRFYTPRPTFRTLSFLLFDHIGGLNTLFHTLFNKGVVIAPEARTVESILGTCAEHQVEVLPTTPTFLRLMLMSGAIPEQVPSSLKVITYGTERMDQTTLTELCRLLPNIDFRQTYGMSELGIVRAKSEARDSLYLKIGGEGVDTKVVDGILKIRSQSRMLGYLNAPSPFDNEGWYDTHDVVEEKDGHYKIVGRIGDIVNVGGLKFMTSEVEKIALAFPNISLAKAYGKNNPITGQHVELKVEPDNEEDFDLASFKDYLKGQLYSHMLPKRIIVEKVAIGHRFKLA